MGAMARTRVRPGLAIAVLVVSGSLHAEPPAAGSGPPKGERKHGDARPPAAAGSHPRPFDRGAPFGSAMPRGSASGQAPDHHHGFKSERMRKRLSELEATHKQRREAHLALMRAKYSAAQLGNQSLFQELRHHARRMAFLRRAQLIAENEVEPPKRASLMARIEKLITKENARHERHVARLNDARPGPSASAAASGPPPLPRGPASRPPTPKPAPSAGGAP